MAQPNAAEDNPIPAHHTAMLEACKSGNLSALQELFQYHRVEKETRPRDNDSSPPMWKMLTAAVAHERVSIVAYLLPMCEEDTVKSESVLRAIIDNPCMEIMVMLHAHSPGIINTEFEYNRAMFIIEACRGDAGYDSVHASDKTTPLIYFLIDNGAQLNERWILGTGALGPAVSYGRPLEVLEKIVLAGGIVDFSALVNAVREKRIDALNMFFDKGKFYSSLSDVQMLECARKHGNEEIVSCVEDGIKRLKRRKRYEVVTKPTSNKKEHWFQEPGWWQFWKSRRFWKPKAEVVSEGKVIELSHDDE